MLQYTIKQNIYIEDMFNQFVKAFIKNKDGVWGVHHISVRKIKMLKEKYQERIKFVGKVPAWFE